MPKLNKLLHEGPFLDEGGPEKQPIYLCWPYTLNLNPETNVSLHNEVPGSIAIQCNTLIESTFYVFATSVCPC